MKEYLCDWCGKNFMRHECYTRGKRHLFCCRQCLADYSNKAKNPDGYDNLKDYTNMAINFSMIAKKLNPSRMTPQVREKIRNSLLGSGDGKTYEKTYGKHTHRVVAEQLLGRPLAEGEVVHHLDGNPRNNNPDNIRVFPSQREHAEFHAKLYAFFMGGGDAE
ncbi:HNH endonuclease signature motif containing protein [Dehalococcoides mccartyi]